MGNNPSSTRKSLASGPQIRKSFQSQSNHQNLEEEFSDLILHEVKRQKHDHSSASNVPVFPATGHIADPDTATSTHFSKGLIEDEFNELNLGIIENVAEDDVLRKIIPEDEETFDAPTFDPEECQQTEEEPVESEASGPRPMDVDQLSETDYQTAGVSPLDFADFHQEQLAKIDFTQAALPVAARYPGALATRSHNGLFGVSVGNSTSSVSVPSRTNLNASLVPVKIRWVNFTNESIGKVSIIGSFSNWHDIIKLKRSLHHPNEYSTTVKLPLGVHKLLFVVNNEYRVLELLPTATDKEGIFFNWFEVLDPQHLFTQSPLVAQGPMNPTSDQSPLAQVAGEYDASKIQKKSISFLMRESKLQKDTGSHEHVEYVLDTQMGDLSKDRPASQTYDTYHYQSSTSFFEEDLPREESLEYSSEIPEMLTDYNYFKNKGPDYELPEPPQLPAHLNNVLLNKMSSSHQANHSQNVPQVGSAVGGPKRPALRRADSSYYASNSEAYHRVIPNHVILNHLMTTSIRNNVLPVACITRYSGKFVTQIMHSPADTPQ